MRRTLIPLLVLLATALAACGSAGSGDDPGSLVPAESGIYADVVLDPEGDQERAVRSIVARFPGGQAGPRALIERALESGEKDFSFEEDVDPWLGDDAAFFLRRVGRTPEVAAVVATTDADAALDTIEKAGEEDDAEERSHEGSDYFVSDDTAAGIVDGHLVIGTESGFRAAAETADGDSLTEQDDFENAIDELSDDRLATFYLDIRKVISAARSAGIPRSQLGPLLDLYRDPISFAAIAEDDAAVIESVLPASITSFIVPFLGSGSEIVAGLPAGSWLATGSPDLGGQLNSALELFAGLPGGGREIVERQLRAATGLGLDELTGWMGDLGLFARGASLGDLGVGMVIETKDPAASRRAIDAIGTLARRAAEGDVSVGPLQLAGGGPGFTVTSAELPAPIHVTQRGDRVVAALSDAAARDALDPRRTLGDDPTFSEAADRLGEGYLASAYIEIGPILRLAESAGAAGDEDYQQAKPYLEVFERLIAGATSAERGESLTSRLRIELR